MFIFKSNSMKNSLFLYLFIIFIVNSFAQNLRGKILDVSTNLPLEGVHVYLKKDKGVFTDAKGKFLLKISNKQSSNDSVYFSHVGFILKKISVEEIRKSRGIIYLDIKQVNLDEITINKDIKLKPTIKYTNLPSMSKGIYGFDFEVVDNKLYVFGGDISRDVDGMRKIISDDPTLGYSLDINPSLNLFEILNRANSSYFSYEGYNDKIFIYDIDKNRWYEGDKTIKKRAYHNTVLNNDKVYILGGKRLSTNRRFQYLENNIEVLDLNDNSITIDKTNPHRAANFSSFVYNDNLIVLGGSIKEKRNGDKLFSNEVHALDFKTGYWYELGKIPQAKETSGVLIGDKIYLIGGFNNKPLKGIESYDLKTGKWKKEGELFNSISTPALAYKEDSIFIYEKGKLCTFDVKNKVIREYNILLDIISPKMFYKNNKLYILGGYKKGEYSVEGASEFVSIDLSEFYITRVSKTKTIGTI